MGSDGVFRSPHRNDGLQNTGDRTRYGCGAPLLPLPPLQDGGCASDALFATGGELCLGEDGGELSIGAPVVMTE
ncbi:MAG: hypothetical protein GY772_29200 [bacterium]|nr:hypothetical protein [bacterium]